MVIHDLHSSYFSTDHRFDEIQYIEDNDVTDMEMTFTEDEYDSSGRLIRVQSIAFGRVVSGPRY